MHAFCFLGPLTTNTPHVLPQTSMRREGTIEYTDEYNRFMARLEAFHQKHG